MDAATAALKDSAPPGIGMLINSVALSWKHLEIPLPSFPITRQKESVKSTLKHGFAFSIC